MTREPVGSVAEEAAKLFAVLQHDPAASSYQGAYQGAFDGHKAGPECQWCPLCQLVRLVRHSGPETVEHLATAAAGVLSSVRALVDAAAESARQAQSARAESGAGATGGAGDTNSHPHPGVDRIDVSEDPEPWD
jgi:hypothetical protein